MCRGVPSFCAAAARLNISLTGIDTPLHIYPAAEEEDLAAALRQPGTKILMKSARRLPAVLAALTEQGLAGRSALVANCGPPGELALPRLDAVARIGRMSFQELFSVDDMAHAEGWRKLLCNTYFATIITLAGGFVLTQVGYSNIWPLFGSANQLLSALVLVTLCVFLKVTGRSNKMLFPPLVIMLCVTFTALVQRLIALIRAFQAGSATFMLEGLQLIIAVLLIALGLTIVVNSLRSYFKARHNSEVE